MCSTWTMLTYVHADSILNWLLFGMHNNVASSYTRTHSYLDECMKHCMTVVYCLK